MSSSDCLQNRHSTFIEGGGLAQAHGLAPTQLRVYRARSARYAGSSTLSGRVRMQNKRSGILAAALLLTMSSALFAQSKEASSMPKVGDMAPDFTLKYFQDGNLKDMKLSDFRGKKNVVLAFYIFAFTGG